LRRRRRQRPESVPPAFAKTAGAREADSTEVRQLMYGSGPTSPIPGPQSTSTGMETAANESSVQDSMLSSVSPRTVESGGGTVYEMQGMLAYPTSRNAESMLTLPRLLTYRASHAVQRRLRHPCDISTLNSNAVSSFSYNH
jgi:hypothetical protein